MTGEEEGAPLGEAESAEGAVIAQGACPYLGMVGDSNAHHSFPSRLHLCHAGEPAHIGLGFQADYCLGGLYPSCARYQRAEEAAAAGAPLVATAAVAAEPPLEGAALAATSAGATAAVPASAPSPIPSASYGRVTSTGEPGGRTSPVVSVLLGLALLATIFAFAAAAGFIKLPNGGPVAVVTTPPASASLSTSPSASPSATASAAPTGSATAPATTAPPSAPPTTQPTTATGEVMHTVAAGETLFGIGLQYNVPWLEIAARNQLKDPYVIHIGDVLIIPVGGTPSASPGESPSATSFTYVVLAGDRLSTIALKFHVTQQAILDANPTVTDPNKIFVGQQLVIPAAAP